ncbi:MAG TPA: hypothetical protein VMT87_11450 [Vicinamibacteria bacterium]|nr:hypothetical protein [Vicinamibacteria bacterium]
MPSRRPALAGVLALAVLAGALLLQGFVEHTDDGCQTEIHCLVCRAAHVRAAAPTAAPGPAVVLVCAGAPAAAATLAVTQAPPSDRSSRGPPLGA